MLNLFNPYKIQYLHRCSMSEFLYPLLYKVIFPQHFPENEYAVPSYFEERGTTIGGINMTSHVRDLQLFVNIDSSIFSFCSGTD